MSKPFYVLVQTFAISLVTVFLYAYDPLCHIKVRGKSYPHLGKLMNIPQQLSLITYANNLITNKLMLCYKLHYNKYQKKNLYKNNFMLNINPLRYQLDNQLLRQLASQVKNTKKLKDQEDMNEVASRLHRFTNKLSLPC